ncbi:MAG TPA: glycosyltransferase [Terriglobales bacterium]|nr:glycosyltransferase [Terriglobales bacterium]
MSSFNIHFFAHSWVSDWNHGNAHFLRGLARSLQQLGHHVHCYEELGSWSLSNLVRNEGELAVKAIDDFRREYPDLNIQFYNNDASFPQFAAEHLREADIVIIHEWNDPQVVNSILELKQKFGFKALFHDTHHRAYTSPRDILRFRLDLFDGVLAFGEAIRKIYTDGFGIAKAWTFHEAADVEKFRPINAPKEIDVVWVGNWGDEERTRELKEFLIEPAAAEPSRKTVVHGVRYPVDALALLEAAGIEYRGYLPNLSAPQVYGRSKLTLHVPRCQYSNGLSGIPTIRVFEAMACGIPLICSPWQDVENLFRPGTDYLVVSDGNAMNTEIAHLLKDDAARAQIAANAIETVRNRHTCEHRAQQLVGICEEIVA